MNIKEIKLKNYRNYDEFFLDLENGVNIIYGKNAVGKTNFLEAIYMTSTTKSHKNSKDKEIIKFGETEAHIKEKIIIKNKENIIDIHLKKNSNKGIAINKKKITKISEYLGFINIIFFSPDDLNIIKEGPFIRRKFIDSYICQIDNIYTYNLSKYNKILNQKNKLLKQIKISNYDKTLIDTIDMWNIELSKYGKEIIKKRREYINDIKEEIKNIHFFISEEKELLNINYEENINEEDFLKTLNENKQNEIKYETTLYGPQRDDVSFFIKDTDIRKFGSQGQIRTTSLSIKIAELNKIKQKKQDTPILLLDDVFSELDTNRQKLLIENIKNIQTIITTTGIKENLLKLLNPKKTIEFK